MKIKKAFKTDKNKINILKIYDEILNLWKIQYDSFLIDTKFGVTHIIRSGKTSNPVIILLHGTSSNSSFWLDEAEAFSKYYCVYAIDMLGEPGKSQEYQYSLEETIYFEWFNEVVNNLNLKKFSIVGISLGAWLGVGYSIRYPNNIEKLVLISPSGIGRQKVSFIFKALPLMFLGDFGLKLITKLVNGNKSIPKEVVDCTIKIAKNFNLRTEVVPIYSDDELASLKMPLLVYVGEKDVMLDSKQTLERMNRLVPSAKVNMLKGFGHVIIGLKTEILEFLIGEN